MVRSSRKLTALLVLTSIIAFSASAQLGPDLQDRINQGPDTERIDVIIQITGPSEVANEAVRNAGGEVNKEFSIINGVAVTIPKVAADNLAQRNFVERIDPDYEMQTSLDSTVSQINTEEAWNSDATGQGVDIAVLDTGVTQHSALNVVDQIDFTGEGTGDLDGHGTHVAGISASQDDNYRGVSYESGIFDIKVLESDGTGSASDVISGIEWAVDNNIQVMTLSLGAPVEECDGEDAVSSAVNNAFDRGTLPVVAAGNEGPESESITLPGCAEDALTVGSVGSDNEASSFSSRGPTADGRVKPDVVAPGESVTSTWYDGGFQTLSGTSMATPHVSGTAAVILGEDSSLTTEEVRATIVSTSDDLGLDENTQGAGLVNVYEAYNAVAEENETEVNETDNFPPVIEEASPVDEVVNDTVEGSGIDVDFSAVVSDNDSNSVDVVFEWVNGTEIQSFTGEPTLESKYTVTGLSEGTSYEWRVEASDGNSTVVSEDLPFTTASSSEEAGDNETDQRNDSELPPGLQDREELPPAFTDRTPANPRGITYGLSRAFERVSLAMTFSEERKAEKRVEFAERRLAEASTLEEGDERRERLLQEYRNNVEQARQVADRNNESDRSRGISERIRGLEQAERQISQNPGQGTPGGPSEERSQRDNVPEESDRGPGGDAGQSERPEVDQGEAGQQAQGEVNQRGPEREGGQEAGQRGPQTERGDEGQGVSQDRDRQVETPEDSDSQSQLHNGADRGTDSPGQDQSESSDGADSSEESSEASDSDDSQAADQSQSQNSGDQEASAEQSQKQSDSSENGDESSSSSSEASGEDEVQQESSQAGAGSSQSGNGASSGQSSSGPQNSGNGPGSSQGPVGNFFTIFS